MKTIGLLGGMSWESTANYYKAINQGVNKAKGGLHSAKIVMHSVDFAEIAQLQHADNWQRTAEILSQAALSLEKAGAEGLLICTNTMHKVAEDIESQLSIPLLHIADATAELLKQQGVTKVGLLGTRFTMEHDFYKQRLIDKFGIDVVVPNGVQRQLIHDVIYNELVKGQVLSSSRQDYLEVICDLCEKGAQAVILGCTEIAMLINQQHTSVPLYDTTQIHSDAAVTFALAEQ